MPVEEWLTTSEAAAYTKDAPKTIQRAAEAGELRGYQRKPGAPWKFRPSDLDRWVAGTSAEPGGAA